jgi:hypothetical protein
MAGQPDHLRTVGEVIHGLRGLGFDPVLVGGMALVVLGSRRVTRDFDFVVERPGDRLRALVGVFYDRGLELASRLDKAGNVVSTIENREVAGVRLRVDAPASGYFFDSRTGLRIDLLFDFPLPAVDLAKRARRLKIGSQTFAIASEVDLLRLKRIAAAARSVPGDADDVTFLESLRKRRKATT